MEFENNTGDFENREIGNEDVLTFEQPNAVQKFSAQELLKALRSA